jgi:hypothetical protein
MQCIFDWDRTPLLFSGLFTFRWLERLHGYSDDGLTQLSIDNDDDSGGGGGGSSGDDDDDDIVAERVGSRNEGDRQWGSFSWAEGDVNEPSDLW